MGLNWVDTYWGIMFPGIMTAFGAFLMKQFFEGVPNELLDAARIDGVSEFGLFWNIAMPAGALGVGGPVHLHLPGATGTLSSGR